MVGSPRLAADARALGLDVVVGRGDERVSDPGEGAGLVGQLELYLCGRVGAWLDQCGHFALGI